MLSPFQPADIAFKEWSLVCDALRDGNQSLLLRKGGIAEGRGGFSFSHDRFWFFPTYFHTQPEQVKTEVPAGVDPTPEAPRMGEEVAFDLAGEIVARGRVENWEEVEALADLHIWKDEVLRERYEYEEDRCLWVAVVRCYRVEPVRTEPMVPGFKGCRSWIKLPESPDPGAFSYTPALEDEEFAQLLRRVGELVPSIA